MANAPKIGLDYFPVNVTWDNGLSRFFLTHGAEGIGYYILLLRVIYANGYYIDFDAYVLAHECNTDMETIGQWVKKCIDFRLFDKDKFDAHNILTSKGIQKRWRFASSKRINNTIHKDFNLLDTES